ncbi:NAD(P)-dependent oxidoreductase [Leucobacter coleopterorum]|uniref:NAD(P)-dependent oxidoreductase n=1 Tax=Leucobacter coleopterorum TaxID=2714933 RepID=UPI001FCC9242|nr:NAD(P)-dependent oxidoreductase [Leucobacter coleopterorum]
MVAEGALELPVISVNNARTKTDFDNLIGTGQSCVLAIADALEEHAMAVGERYQGVFGTRWVVVGYGPVGVGVARFAAALGARVTVVERDPVRALAALHDGFEAQSTEQALPVADVVVSATGVWHTVTAAGFELLREGTAVAVAGGSMTNSPSTIWRRTVGNQLCAADTLVSGSNPVPIAGHSARRRRWRELHRIRG